MTAAALALVDVLRQNFRALLINDLSLETTNPLNNLA